MSHYLYRLDTAAETRQAMPAAHRDAGVGSGDFDEIIALAREAGLLITLDAQIGREKYQSVAGSLAAFGRFVETLRANFAREPAAA